MGICVFQKLFISAWFQTIGPHGGHRYNCIESHMTHWTRSWPDDVHCQMDGIPWPKRRNETKLKTNSLCHQKCAQIKKSMSFLQTVLWKCLIGCVSNNPLLPSGMSGEMSKTNIFVIFRKKKIPFDR